MSPDDDLSLTLEAAMSMREVLNMTLHTVCNENDKISGSISAHARALRMQAAADALARNACSSGVEPLKLVHGRDQGR